MRRNFWKKTGLTVILAAILTAFAGNTALLHSWENSTYLAAMKIAARTPYKGIEIVALDQQGLEQLGGRPWPRDVYSKVIEKLSNAGARLIGVTELFEDARIIPGSEDIGKLLNDYEASVLVNEFHCEDDASLSCKDAKKETTEFGRRLRDLQNMLDSDQRFADTIQKSARVILPMRFIQNEPVPVEATDTLEEPITNNRLSKISDNFDSNAIEPPYALAVVPPLEIFSEAALGIGALSRSEINYENLVLRYQEQYFPSLALLLAAKTLKLDMLEVEVTLEKGVRLDKIPVTTDSRLRMRRFLYFPDYTPAFPVKSFYQIYSNEANLADFRDKIILIGEIPPGGIKYSDLPPVISLAHSLSNILQQDFVYTPAWHLPLQIVLFLLIVLYLGFVLPHSGGFSGLFFSLMLLSALFAAQSFLLAAENIWLPLILPALFVIIGHLVFSVAQGWHYYQWRIRMNSESVAETRLAALAYQGQGRLELAFEKFLQCPPDDLIMSLLYNLALDFERKRQAREALAVYRYMSQHNADFRDVGQRMLRLQKSRQKHFASTTDTSIHNWLDDPHQTHPTLGRYQIERKIAKGSMGGDVYLGKDPKLDRMVALKTLALSEEFEGEELQEATTRFFREAAAAGRLNHPNIIAVYDAGEEHNLAYISMEFFKGGNLVPYTKDSNKLALPDILKAMMSAANALDYAHKQGVVHRDIKPANMLFNPANNEIKLTDFGIARITDTNKTKTGVILGTPSYMSPEQLAGKNVDGKSDLFSLGITMYQLLSGELPFNADSMASLMFQIANEPHPDISEKCPDLPLCVKTIVDTLLQKQPENRYSDGAETVTALQECLKQINPQPVPVFFNGMTTDGGNAI